MQTKSSQRRLAYDLRNAQENRENLSQIICAKVQALTDYQQADVILWYLHCRSEVQTQQAVLSELLKQQKKIVIPYCTVDKQGKNHLGLWHLVEMSELVPGTWGILEPPKERWGELGKEIAGELIDLVIVPGVAFDSTGSRLGNGAGYYDRLFPRLRSDCKLLGIGFDSQIIEQITMQAHDVYMHSVITQSRIFPSNK